MNELHIQTSCTEAHKVTICRPIDPQELEAYATEIRKCRNTRNLQDGRRIHSDLVSRGYIWNSYLRNGLIQMYGSCGCLTDAKQVFDGTKNKNLYTWNMLISAYVKNHDLEGARELFDSASQRCHVTWNTMMAAYAQQGHIQTARDMFNKMPGRNIISWNTIIAAYVQRGHMKEAKKLFESMTDRNVVTWNTMVTAYAQDGHLSEAREFFENMPDRNTVSWNALITAYVQNERSSEALLLFCTMDIEGVTSDRITLTAGLDACANLEDLRKGRVIYESMHAFDLTVMNSAINMYGKCGNLGEACTVFWNMPEHDVVSWTALVVAYCRNDRFKEAFSHFRVMLNEGVRPDAVAFMSALEACGNLVCISDGRMVHNVIVESGPEFIYHNKVESALISMYGKCGSLKEAQVVLEKLHTQDHVSWTAMIASYAQQGLGKEALELFHTMILEGVLPDEVTFVSVLCACNHAGRVHDGRVYVQSAVGDYGLILKMQHYACMVDMLGRSGRLVAAEELLATMPFEPDVYTWMNVLSACKTHNLVEQGQTAARLVSELDPKDSTPYVMLYSMYNQKDI